MKSMKSLIVAAISIALAFTFGGGSSDDGGDDTPSSSSGGVVVPSSSSSGGSSSSSSGGSTGGNVVSCGLAGEGVKIGEQCWLKKNLDVPHNESNGESWCYEGSDYYSTGEEVEITAEEGCAKYGRLYNWAAAMDLPSYCNSESCADLIQQPKHRGHCPQGFHVPTDDDWDELMEAVGGEETAGAKLKSASGWYSKGCMDRDTFEDFEEIPCPPGTDDFGFSALPGGRYIYGYFSDVGLGGFWWSATEHENFADGAYYRDMGWGRDYAIRDYDGKFPYFSVRCVKDN
jgi:uncharacterized protein (TIGR02145 family)